MAVNMKVIVTIPAYNEEKTIGRIISDIDNVMKKIEYNYRILFVNGGSKDRTVEIAKRGDFE
jgi:dolichol-phosphate mannosyltransferase